MPPQSDGYFETQKIICLIINIQNGLLIDSYLWHIRIFDVAVLYKLEIQFIVQRNHNMYWDQQKAKMQQQFFKLINLSTSTFDKNFIKIPFFLTDDSQTKTVFMNEGSREKKTPPLVAGPL